jgi:hypothetical protein
MPAGVQVTEQAFGSEEWLEESVAVEPGGTLYVRLDRGAVEVESHDANEVRVEASARGWASGMAYFTLEKDGDDVWLEGDLDGWVPNLFGGARIEVRAWVPRRFSVEVETRGGHVYVADIGGRLAAQTSGGRISAERINGPALLRTGGGRISAREVNGDLRARTSGGRIDITYVNGDVEALTSGGRIEVHGVAGSIDARTSGGRIEASFVDEPCGRLETSGGAIEVVFREDLGADLDARTSGGRVEVEHPILLSDRSRRSHVVGRINGGGLPLQLRTAGGSIRVRAA